MATGKNRFAYILSFLLIVATAVFFISFSSPVWAEDNDEDSAPDKAKYLLKAAAADGQDEGRGVHKDLATFEKNFDLSVDQKIFTITAIEDAVKDIRNSKMSDLEKYYKLAILSNKQVEYDWNFWGGRYNFDYYSHQWDSYGAMKDGEKSVCVGIAIFYSHMCHAADLPCRFVRLDPNVLDHTINYIPDINGRAYYADITENVFLMSEKSMNSYEPDVDKKFAKITRICNDPSFDYYNEEGNLLMSADIKELYDVPFADWYNEYALHKNTTKKFAANDYVEKGSGLPSDDPKSYHATYQSDLSVFPEKIGIWFLDDFYRDPAGIQTKIENREFDDQLINVSGVEQNYDCASIDELEDAIEQEIADNKISVEYFPSIKNNQIVPEAAVLENGTDYDITCTNFDESANTAELTVDGINDYSGSYKINVKLNSAVVSKDPVSKKGLVYTGKSQALLEPGEAKCGELKGEMQYALGTQDGPTEGFTTAIPTATNVGKYYVWYIAVGDASHESSEPKLMEPVAKIAPVPVNIKVDETIRVKVGETAKLSPKLDAKVQATFKYNSWNPEIATVDDNGVVTGVSEGSAAICINAVLKDGSNYKVDDAELIEAQVVSEAKPEPKPQTIDISETKVRFYKATFTYNGKVQKPTIKTIKGWRLKAGTDYTAAWANESSKNAGTYKVVVTGKGKYSGSTDAIYVIKKAPNTMTLKGKTVKVKRKTLKKKAKTIKRAKAYTVSNAKGTLSYKLVSAKKGKKSFKKKFKVNTKTGKIKVKKRLKKGTYKVKVKVTAAGTANYKAVTKTVTFKVKVK